MTSTKYVFLTLGLLAAASVASAGLTSPPSTGCQSCQQRSQAAVAQWKRSIAGSGSNPGLIQAILNLLDQLLGGLLGWCGNATGGTLLDGLLGNLLGAVGKIVKNVLDLLLGNTTGCIAQKKCHKIATACISKCQTIPGTGGVLGLIEKLVKDLLNGLFGSGATSGTCSGSDGGILDNLLKDVGDLLHGVLGSL